MLAAAAGCVAAFGLLMWLAYYVPPAQWLDGAALNGFVALQDRLGGEASRLAQLFNPGVYPLLVIPVLGYALLARRFRHAAAALLLLVGANVSSQVLKVLLGHFRDLSHWPGVGYIGPQAFPSGHATASMALAFAAVLVAPRAYRPIVAVAGGLLALAVSLAVVVLAWHFPSDVVGGQLLAATWCLVSLAALRYSRARWPEHGSMRQAARETFVLPSRRALTTAGISILAAVALVAAALADPIASFAQRHTAAVAVGAAISASAVALLAGVTALAARR